MRNRPDSLRTAGQIHANIHVGWSVDSKMPAELALDAFQMGVRRQQCAPIVVHSDRGSQYASNVFREELEPFDCIQSMSRKGDCWDNAVAESFFGSLKNECIHRTIFTTRSQAQDALFEYIEIFYNRNRLHSHIGYLTPEEKMRCARMVA